MPRARPVVKEFNEEDEKLRREFEEFGETIGEITDQNRPLLVKKLNHLRARRRMSEKLSQSLVKESQAKRPVATSKRGRGKGKKSAKNESSHEAPAADNENGNGDQLNSTFDLSDTSPDAYVKPAAKRSRNDHGGAEFVASEGPYAVARKKAAAKTQNTTVQDYDKPSKSGSTSTALLSETFTAGSGLHSVAKSDEPKRGRAHVDESGGGTRLGKALMEPETFGDIGSSVSPHTKRKARSTVPIGFGGKASVAEASSLSAAIMDVSAADPTAEKRGHGSGGDQQCSHGDTTQISQNSGRQAAAASRIPKLARFPVPPQQVADTSVKARTSAASTVVNSTPKVIARVTDTVSGRPAAGIATKLFVEKKPGTWSSVAESLTDEKGTTACDGSEKRLDGKYRLQFDTGSYYDQLGMPTLYPHVDVVFSADKPANTVEVALVLGPFGYSTHARIDRDD